MQTTEIVHVFEAVDATDEEQYFTLGIFLTEESALAILNKPEPECYYGLDTESITIEIRQRKIGLHPYAWDKIASKTWWRNYDDGEKWFTKPAAFFNKQP